MVTARPTDTVCYKLSILQMRCGCPDWLSIASSDADLQRVLSAWDALPQAIRAASMAVICTVASTRSRSALLAQGNRSGLEEIGRRITRKCRQVVQGCLGEEEWLVADQKFFDIIVSEIQSAADNLA